MCRSVSVCTQEPVAAAGVRKVGRLVRARFAVTGAHVLQEPHVQVHAVEHELPMQVEHVLGKIAASGIGARQRNDHRRRAMSGADS